MVLWALENALGSEIFVPKIPSYRITDLAAAINPNADMNIVGLRPGEKIHEEMITASDSPSTIDLKQYYAILPPDGLALKNYTQNSIKFESLPPDFSYNSATNPMFLSTMELRDLIKTHVDKSL